MSITASTMQGAPVHTRPAAGKGVLLGYLAELHVSPGIGQITMVGIRSRRFWGAVRYYDARLLDAVRGRLYLREDKQMSVDTMDSASLRLEKSLVFTSSGTFLGLIDDLYFDKTTFMLTQIEVVRRLLFVPYLKLLIGREDIVDIRPKQVIVRDAVLREADLASLLLRKSSALVTPQPQQSRR